MMGTLATVLATRKISTVEDRFRADVEGDIREVGGVLRITHIRVRYALRVEPGREDEARECLSLYLVKCPAAQSVRGCIDIAHSLEIATPGAPPAP